MNSYNADQLNTIEPGYLANYGLTHSPFGEQHDDRFLYLDAERAQRLNLLQHLTQYSNLLLIAKGEQGIGKSSLLTRFMRNAADDLHICMVSANAMMDAGQLLYQVAKGFGIRRLPQDSADLQDLLYDHIATFHHRGKIPLMLVDDAHTLPKDALIAIYHLADARVDDGNLVRIMLFAEPQIDKVLGARDLRQLRERVTHTMEIPAFNEETTAEYLKHRLAVAGFNGGSPFTPDMVKRIYRASGGNPAHINQLALEILDKGDIDSEGPEEIDMDSNKPGQHRYRRVIAVAVVLIVLVLVIQHRITRLFGDNPESKTIPLQVNVASPPGSAVTDASTPVSKAPDTAAMAPDPNVAPAPDTDSVSTPLTQASPVPGPAPTLQEKIIPLHPDAKPPAAEAATPATVAPGSGEQVKVTPAVATDQVTLPEAVQQAPQTTSAPGVTVVSVEPNPVPASNQQQTMTINGEGFTRDSRVYVSWADHDEEIPPARVKYISERQLQVALTVGTTEEKWQLRVNDAQHGNSNSLRFAVATQAARQAQTNDWVMARDPGAFTLQLFGSREKNNAEAFIRQHGLDKQAHYFVSMHKGVGWYSVIYGVYPDQAAAQKAMGILSASLGGIKPWVRRFDDIQASATTAHKSQRAEAKPVARPSSVLAQDSALPKHADVKQYESWLWSQDPSNFTLQLMGARDDASIQKFIQRHNDLAGNLVYFHSRHDGRDWYAVVYGVYADKAKAHAAIERLPPALQKASPWVRSFASIHAELAHSE